MKNGLRILTSLVLSAFVFIVFVFGNFFISVEWSEIRRWEYVLDVSIASIAFLMCIAIWYILKLQPHRLEKIVEITLAIEDKHLKPFMDELQHFDGVHYEILALKIEGKDKKKEEKWVI
jgi:hypothetical protein